MTTLLSITLNLLLTFSAKASEPNRGIVFKENTTEIGVVSTSPVCVHTQDGSRNSRSNIFSYNYTTMSFHQIYTLEIVAGSDIENPEYNILSTTQFCSFNTLTWSSSTNKELEAKNECKLSLDQISFQVNSQTVKCPVPNSTHNTIK